MSTITTTARRVKTAVEFPHSFVPLVPATITTATTEVSTATAPSAVAVRKGGDIWAWLRRKHFLFEITLCINLYTPGEKLAFCTSPSVSAFSSSPSCHGVSPRVPLWPNAGHGSERSSVPL
ncbi:hypothetical protein PCL_09756 [Purpureocillium lilacinum]|uniref:Uncharacterized protein n=1 Tax=Purpureocillium lilacinum TaxID=33203 RepID=A0A2U3EDZ3_PURLI|nr:hypothetical protein Purlil1_1220 [Purpureocillium lilacinum]PWI72741.1 hypothetical protein PCL_09756 [Purpureocillium lilacinum]